MRKQFIVKASRNTYKSKNVFAAEDDDLDFQRNIDDFEDEGLDDTLDDVADAVEDMQDTIEDVQEDPVNIEIENNISDHYIAECEKCHGIFISATIESDQQVSKVTGECPLCGEESDQYLKWIVREVNTGFAEPDPDVYMYNQM